MSVSPNRSTFGRSSPLPASSMASGWMLNAAWMSLSSVFDGSASPIHANVVFSGPSSWHRAASSAKVPSELTGKPSW